METPTARMQARLGALAATTTLVLGAMVATIAPAQAIAAPGGLRATQVASKGVGLTWNTTGEGAYRVRFSASSSMSSPETWDVIGNYLEWTRTDANPTARASRLTPGKTYYFQVKAITKQAVSEDRENLSSYSSPFKVTLPTTGPSELRPVNLTATPGGADTMYVSWRSRGPGFGYVLRYTTDPSAHVLHWMSVKLDAAGGKLAGLKPGTKYYFRARVIDSAGKGVSDYSSSGFSATTLATTTSPGLSVISYNVRKIYSTSDWGSRRAAVAANILARQPDVLGLQEASPIRWATNNAKQYDDLINLLGSQYSLVTRTGSSGSKLAYNKDRLTVVKTGVKKLYEYGSAARYGVWAMFEDKVSGKTFFVIDTHLEPGSQTSSTLNDVRIVQANQVLDLVKANAGGRPVVIIGDMNSSRSAKPNNGQYRVFTGAGYVDPLDNATGNWASGANATAEHILDAQYNSSNGLEEKAHLTAYPVGTNIDYVYVSPNIRVATWRTVVKLDTSGSFVGTIPSDHNLVQIWLHLP